jgi:hypothetical protein
MLSRRCGAAQVLGGASMLTEWGQGCEFPAGTETGECDPVMDLADAHLFSWIDWYWTGALMNGKLPHHVTP